MSWRTLELKNNVSPPMRYGSTAVMLKEKNVYLFGGIGCGLSNELWCLDIDTKAWEPVKCQIGKRNTSVEKCPPPRVNHSMTAGRVSSNNFWVFGGQGQSNIGGGQLDDEQPNNDTNFRTRMISRRTFFNDLFEFDANGNEWVKHMPMGHAPAGRRSHTATFVLDRENKPFQIPDARQFDTDEEYEAAKLKDKGEIIVFGGAGENIKGFEAIFDDVWALDLNSVQWEKLTCSGEVPALFEHSATFFKRDIFVIGGIIPSSTNSNKGVSSYNWGQPVKDIYSLDVDTLVWKKIEFKGSKFFSIHGHTAVLDPAKDSENIIIFGGRSNEINTANIYIYNTDRKEMFTDPMAKSNIPPRYGHVCIPITIKKKKKTKRALQEENIEIEKRKQEDKASKTARKSKAKSKSMMDAGGPKKAVEAPLFAVPGVMIFGGAELKGNYGFADEKTYCFDRLKKDSSNEEEEPDETALLIQQMKDEHREQTLPKGRKKMLLTKMGNYGKAKAMTNTLMKSVGKTQKANSELPFPLPWSYDEMKQLINTRIADKKKAHRYKTKIRASTAPSKMIGSMSAADFGSTDITKRPHTSGSVGLNVSDSTLSILKATKTNRKLRNNESRETIHEKKFRYFKNIRNAPIVPGISRPSTSPAFDLTHNNSLLSSVDNMASIDFHIISRHTPTISLGTVRPKKDDDIW